ncbi:MAG TPA: hypothetical protein VM487_19475 [Phycisphaerae bacterium]|nr:hypothetical protein [Phycisphaerae bacterium]
MRAALCYESVRGPTNIRWPHKPRGFCVQHQALSIAWLPVAESRSFSIPGNRLRVTSVVLPLWIPVVALAIPTTFLWWRDRRVAIAHCQSCGYDLTGNVSGVCPECGMRVEREGKTR